MDAARQPAALRPGPHHARWLLTFGILPYVYGRWSHLLALNGANDLRLLGIVVVTIAVLGPLTCKVYGRRCKRGLGTPARHGW